MARVQKIKYSMPRGDSRSLPVALTADTYSAGASVFFGLKTVVDDDLADSTAVLKKTLTDADIIIHDVDYVHYLLQLLPTDTNTIPPAVYLAEFEFVSADGLTVLTYPDPSIAVWQFTITGDVNRRTA